MHDLLAWTACGSRARSAPFPYPFHPKSKLWNRKEPPWRPGEALSQALRKSRRYLRTSSRDRSALATPDFRSASSLRLAPGHRCQFRWRTSESTAPARFGKGCNELGTNGIARLSEALVVRVRMESLVQEQPYACRVISAGRPAGRSVRESSEQPHLSPPCPYSQASPDWRISEHRLGPGQQSPAVSRR